MSAVDQDTVAPLTGAQILARLNAVGLAFVDSSFSIIGSGDATKVAKFEVDGFTTGTTRTFTLPDATGTLALLGLAQTWSALQTFSGGIAVSQTTQASLGSGSLTTLGGAYVTKDLIARGNSWIISTGVTANLFLSNTTAGATLTGADGFNIQMDGLNANLVNLEAGWLSIWTNNLERLRIVSGGNVLIGSTTDDGTNKLQVAGSGAFTHASGAAVLSLTGNGANESRIRMGGGTGHYNWHAGPNFNVNQAFEITPSTATGGSTFSAPAITIDGATKALSFYGGIIAAVNSGSTVNADFVDTAASRTAAMVRIVSSATAHTSSNLLDITSLASTSSDLMLRVRANSLDLFKITADGGTQHTNTGAARVLTLTNTNATAYVAATSSTWSHSRVSNAAATSDAGAGLEFLVGGNQIAGVIGTREGSGTDTGSLAFVTSLSGTWAERARITSAGSLLLGTTTDNLYPISVAKQRVLTAGLGDSTDGVSILPSYTGNFTVARAGYIRVRQPAVAASAVVTDAVVFHFDDVIGTHKALDSGTTKTSPGTVDGWMKVSVNGTLHYMPLYSSKTT